MLYTIGEVLFNTVMNIMELIIVLLMVQYLCAANVKFTGKYLAVIACFTGALQIILAALGLGEIYEYLQWILVFIFVLIKSRRKLVDFFATAIALFLFEAITLLPYFLISNSLRISLSKYQVLGVNIFFPIFDIFALAAILIARRAMEKYQFIVPFSFGEIVLGIFFGLILFVFLGSIYCYHYFSFVWGIAWTVLVDCCYIALNVFYFYTIIKRRKDLYAEKQLRIQQAYTEMQLDTFDQYKEREDEVRKMRHDFKKHLGLIQVLLDEEKISEAQEYIHNLNDTFKSKIHYITGNEISDAVVNSKCQEAKDQGIAFSYEGSLQPLSSMLGPDICALLANAYENAIEACVFCQEPYINTKVIDTKNFLTIMISNSVAHKPNITFNTISTTKKNKAHHGYGLSIIQQIAKKYLGKVDISSTDSEFSLKIIFSKNQLLEQQGA